MFKNKDGTLTACALACGHVQRISTPAGSRRVDLYQDGCYHVRDEMGAWDSYDTLAEARAGFRRLVKRSNLRRKYVVSTLDHTGATSGPIYTYRRWDLAADRAYKLVYEYLSASGGLDTKHGARTARHVRAWDGSAPLFERIYDGAVRIDRCFG